MASPRSISPLTVDSLSGQKFVADERRTIEFPAITHHPRILGVGERLEQALGPSRLDIGEGLIVGPMVYRVGILELPIRSLRSKPGLRTDVGGQKIPILQ